MMKINHMTEEKQTQMVENVKATLTANRHRYTDVGIEAWVNTFAENKADLLDLLAKMPGYNGNGQVIINHPMERENSAYEVRNFISLFPDNIGADKKIIKKKNKDGKTLKQIIKEENEGQLEFVDVRKISATKFRERKNTDEFTFDGEIKASVEDYNNFTRMIDSMKYCSGSTINKETADNINSVVSDVRAQENMKTSRLFNKICSMYGIADQKAGSTYTRLFTDYSNLVSGLKRQMVFIISCNMVDYLNMSNGNSWTSCHRLGNGAYLGGCPSYMFDKTSLITYVVPKQLYEANKDHPEILLKTYRNMFHYDRGNLIQSRIYPQGNDGAKDLYKDFRLVMEKAISDGLSIEDKWTKPERNCGDVTTNGTHYPDYSYNSNVYRVRLNGTDNVNIAIGHEGICPCCGNSFTRRFQLVCDRCY